MNRTLRLFLLLSTILGLAGCGKDAEKPKAAASTATTTPDQRVSYGLGYNLGRNLSEDKVLKLDQDQLKAGIADGLAKAKTAIPEADLQAAFVALQERARSQAQADGEKALAAGNDYLAKNKLKPGVKTTASGLQYEVLKSGKGGPKPKATSQVNVHYHGTLIDGTVFDSSVERGQPIEIGLNEVVPGWTEALQLMSVGDKWKITLPAALAYGPRPKGNIPANSALIFEVELLGFK